MEIADKLIERTTIPLWEDPRVSEEAIPAVPLVVRVVGPATRVDAVAELGVIVFEIDQRNMEQHPKARFKVVVDFMRFGSTFE